MYINSLVRYIYIYMEFNHIFHQKYFFEAKHQTPEELMKISKALCEEYWRSQINTKIIT